LLSERAKSNAFGGTKIVHYFGGTKIMQIMQAFMYKLRGRTFYDFIVTLKVFLSLKKIN